MTQVFVLIMFIATENSYHSGAGGIAVDFNSQQACLQAGSSLASDTTARNNYVLTWGCFKK